MKAIKYRLGDDRHHRAMNVYHVHYDNKLYAKAIKGKSVRYGNALIDEALALCGSPFYKLSDRRWSAAAVAFLERFA